MDNSFDRRSFLQKGIALAGVAGACLWPSNAEAASKNRENLLKIPAIDTHTHYLTAEYRQALLRHSSKGHEADGLPTPIWSLEKHLEKMDRWHIGFAWLSLASPHPHWGDPKETTELVRGLNEFGNEIVKKYPDKFALFASLPLPDLESSLEELHYCEKNLQVAGYKLPTNIAGHYPGDSLYEPILDELNRLKAVVIFHPNTPRFASAIPEVPLAVVEYMLETTKSISNLIIQGLVERYKGIRWVIPHAGALLPSLVERLEGMKTLIANYKGGKVIDMMKSFASLYFDLAGFPFPNQLYGLLQMTSCEHLLYGSDWPYALDNFCTEQRKRLVNSDLLDETQIEKILHFNASQLVEVKKRW